MATFSISELRTNLPEMVNRAAFAGERILIARHNKKLAALVSAADLDLLERLEDYALGSEALHRLSDPKAKVIPLAQAKQRWAGRGAAAGRARKPRKGRSGKSSA